MSRSILDLTLPELEEIIRTNKLPEGTTLDGLEKREDFTKLFRFRSSPANVAAVLVKEKLRPKGESLELKRERLALKEAELRIKKLKAERLSTQVINLTKEVRLLNQKLNLIELKIDELKRLIERKEVS